MIIKVDKVCGGHYVRDLWCSMPYSGSPTGCPQTKRCKGYPLWEDTITPPYHLVIREFDIKEHSDNLKSRFPSWTEKQLRNSRLWQRHQDRLLKDEAMSFMKSLPYVTVYIPRPEEYGVNVVTTARKVGIEIKFPPVNIVKCVGLIGKDINTHPVTEWFK